MTHDKWVQVQPQRQFPIRLNLQKGFKDSSSKVARRGDKFSTFFWQLLALILECIRSSLNKRLTCSDLLSTYRGKSVWSSRPDRLKAFVGSLALLVVINMREDICHRLFYKTEKSMERD